MSGSRWSRDRGFRGEGVGHGEGTGQGEGIEHGEGIEYGEEAGEGEGVRERSGSHRDMPENAGWWLKDLVLTCDFSPKFTE